MDTVILLRSPQPHEADLLKQANQIFVTHPSFIDSSNYKQIELVKPESEKYYFHQSFELIKQFPHQYYAGKKVAEHLTVGGYSLYYYTRFILINRLTPALKEHYQLNQILKGLPAKGKKEKITVFHTSPYTPHYKTNLKIEFKRHGATKAGKLNKVSFYSLFLTRALVGVVKNIFTKRVKHLFLFPQVEPQPLLDRENLSRKNGNPITDYYLQDFLDEEHSYILEERYPLNEGRYRLSISNVFGKYGRRSLPFEPYLLLAMLKLRGSSMLTELAQNENTLFKEVDQESDEGIRLLNHIMKDLRTLRKLGLIRSYAATLLLKKYKPSVIGCIDEYSVKSKSVLDAASELGIKTYAIQHGIIHKAHMGYHYLPEDTRYNTFTDQLFVYGDAIKKLLQDQYHQVKSIEVSGQLRTDIIPILQEKHHQITVKGIDHSKPMILYASQPVFSTGGSEVRDSINRDFFALSKELPNYQFVLKPHPRETDWNYFYTLAKEVKASNFLITNEDIYLLLAKCSMLLTHSSSVGPEAVNFGKPLVVQDYLNIDIVNYIRDGIGFKATNYAELKSVVEKILSGQLEVPQQAFDMYRQQFSGPIDGLVSKRILEAVKT